MSSIKPTEIFGMKPRKNECQDKKCPFHGDLNVKKGVLRGVVVKKDINHSATISWFRHHFVPKYERFEIRRSRIRVHNPPCIDAQIGERVVVAKTRPLSKTKCNVIIGIIEGKTDKELMAEEGAHTKKNKKVKDETVELHHPSTHHKHDKDEE